MTPYIAFALLVFGLALGSFVSMLSYRIPRGLSITGRSFCDHCQKKITWHENIPLLAYFLFKKCRACNSKIPSRYPIIELLTAALFVLTGLLWPGGLNFQLLLFLLAVVLLLTMTIIDFEHQLLPDMLTYLLGFMLLVPLFIANESIFPHLLWGYLAFLFFLLIYLLSRGRGMGFGDVKLAFILGATLSLPNVLVWIFLSFFIGALVGVMLLLAGHAKIGKPVPFGPFLMFSFWATVFWGKDIFVWYQGFL